MARGYRWLGFVIGCVLRLLVLASAEAKVIEQVTVRGGDTQPTLQRHLLERARGCFDSGQLVACVRGEVIRLMERAIDSNVTLRVTPFLTIRKNPEWPGRVAGRETAVSDQSRSGWLGMFTKLREFLLSRVFQFSLVDADGRWLLAEVDEGRGKKHKNKQGGMFSMALMALMAMIAQVILGKVAVLAAVALIMAKIALVFSTLNGLKKSNGAGAGHGSEHVVYEHPSHGGGGGGGWQRSIHPRTPYERYPSYDDQNDLPYRKRRPNYDYQDDLEGA